MITIIRIIANTTLTCILLLLAFISIKAIINNKLTDNTKNSLPINYTAKLSIFTDEVIIYENNEIIGSRKCKESCNEDDIINLGSSIYEARNSKNINATIKKGNISNEESKSSN